jgi:hypothetical protein
MTTRERTARPSAVAIAINWIITAFVILFLFVLLYLMWPMLMARLTQSGVALPSLPTIATAYVAPLSRPQAAPQSAPALNLEQVSATSTAIYQATAAAVDAHPPNVNTTGDSAPLVVEQKPSVREPAGLIVPTAEPIVIPQSDDQTGSRPVLVNPQATHTCRHGQEWVDGKGCRNP